MLSSISLTLLFQKSFILIGKEIPEEFQQENSLDYKNQDSLQRFVDYVPKYIDEIIPKIEAFGAWLNICPPENKKDISEKLSNFMAAYSCVSTIQSLITHALEKEKEKELSEIDLSEMKNWRDIIDLK
ncbi:MAG: hypothetical protein EBU90_01465 [Proteobacteria bacterium]|nr:hypothetical protein [Pseudomonadota bacterium]